MTNRAPALLSLLAIVGSAGLARAQAAPPEPGPTTTEPAAEDATEPTVEPETTEAPPTAAPPTTVAPMVAPAVAPAPPPATPYPWTPPGAAAPAPAPTAPAPVDTKPEEPLPPAGPPGWQAFIGIRTAWHTGAGFDPFSENNVMTGVTLGASRRVMTSGPFSFAGALTFDGGTRKSTARGAPTSLQSFRFLLGPEARWHLIPELYVYLRPSAGVLRSVASLEDSSTGTTLYAKNWVLAADATAGAAFAFADLRRVSGDLRFWVMADGGYGYATTTDLALAPEEDAGAPQRTAALDLGELSLSGPYFRLSAAATF